MTQQERDAAKRAARERKFEVLRVCADPGNMPFSNMHAEGFENKIAETLASAMGAHVSYAWRPTFERGLTRQPMNDLNICDVMVGVPSNFEALLTTTPLYRTTYVFAYRKDRGIKIKNLDDPILKKLKIGVYETSGLRNALAAHGIKGGNVIVMGTSHDSDLVPEHQPWRQVEDVVTGKLDVAATFGPFAGWVEHAQHAPIVLQPTNLMDDTVPMEFSVSAGVRRYDAVLKYALENAMDAKKDEIAAILDSFGVPQVECSDCLISGQIPAHGDYILAASEDESEDRPPERMQIPISQVEKWLAGGTTVDQELHNAALAADMGRVTYLLTKKNANVNSKGDDGETALHLAVINGDTEMIGFLLDHHANIDQPDSDSYSPLALAAARNKTPAIKVLLARGANIEATIPGDYTPLFIATAQGKLAAAKQLIEAGAKCRGEFGPQHLTLLMAIATQTPPERRLVQVMQKVDPVQIAEELIAHGAEVNAVSTKGVTALMIAAAHDNAPMIGALSRSGANASVRSAEGQTALDIAQQNGNEAATRMLGLLGATGAAPVGSSPR
jgi:quinoprotein dehydrogenase-associated probable ABC transporter substrate-binding protein